MINMIKPYVKYRNKIAIFHNRNTCALFREYKKIGKYKRLVQYRKAIIWTLRNSEVFNEKYKYI